MKFPLMIMEQTMLHVATTLNVNVSIVAHFYVDIPETLAEAPSYPFLS